MKKPLLFLVIAFALTAPAFALPDHEQTTYYYDSQGNVIGEQGILCGYPWYYSSGDTSGDSYTTVIGFPCDTMEPWIGCEDIGMTSIGSCGVGGWCVSEGYALSFGLDEVPNCEGICLHGEGPGAFGCYYRSTCAQIGPSCDPQQLGCDCP